MLRMIRGIFTGTRLSAREASDLVAAIDDLKGKNDSLQRLRRQLFVEAGELRSNIEALKTQRDDLKVNLESFRQQAQRLRDEKRELQDQVGTLQNKTQILEEQNESLKESTKVLSDNLGGYLAPHLTWDRVRKDGREIYFCKTDTIFIERVSKHWYELWIPDQTSETFFVGGGKYPSLLRAKDVANNLPLSKRKMPKAPFKQEDLVEVVFTGAV